MKDITLIVKVTDGCNLRCKYCYNKDTGYAAQTLGCERFEKLLKIVAPYRKDINVIWHGGEPLTCGTDRFLQFMKTESAVAKAFGVNIKNRVQTNGTLIDRKWVKLFKEYDVKVGISFDGIENEKYRQRSDDTLRGIGILRKNGIYCGVMAVVADNEYDIAANYRYFAAQKLNVEFSPVFQEGGATELSSPAKNFADKMVALFDEWLYDKNGVDVRLFATYVSMALGTNFRICSNSSCHGKYLGITADGTLYNCGRYSVTKYPFGNVDDFNGLDEVYRSQGFKELVAGAIERRNTCKRSCEYFAVCGGGCSDCAIVENGLSNIPQQSCLYFKTLYSHIKATVDEILEKKIPLDTFNPYMRKTIVKSFAVTDDASGADVEEKYQK